MRLLRKLLKGVIILSKVVPGCYYRGVIDKTNEDDKLSFVVEVECHDGKLFRTLIDYIEGFEYE